MSINWKSASHGQIPDGAIIAGHEANGTPLFLCRAKSQDGLYPGRLRLRFKAANIGLSGIEIKVEDYEVYCGGAKWVKASDGNIPDGSIVVGHEPGGEPLYAARGKFNRGLHIGKAKLQFNGALIPWGNQEHLLADYEVLVEK